MPAPLYYQLSNMSGFACGQYFIPPGTIIDLRKPANQWSQFEWMVANFGGDIPPIDAICLDLNTHAIAVNAYRYHAPRSIKVSPDAK
jgi:hypothetical protein